MSSPFSPTTATSTFDAFSDVLTVEGPLAGAADTTRLRYNQADEVSLSYTDNGKPLYVVDGEGNVSRYYYDGFDRVSHLYYPSKTTTGAIDTGDVRMWVYDAAGNLAYERRRDASYIYYSYDNLGRMTLKDGPNVAYWETDQAYSYDNLGRLIHANDSVGHWVEFAYDALGRKVSEDRLYYGIKTSQYDLAGRRTRLTWDDDFFVAQDYLVTGEMSAIRERDPATGLPATSGLGVLVRFSYDDLGRRIGITRGNGTLTNYGYDAASRLTSLTQNLGATANDLTLTFAYNPAGQIVSNTRSNDLYAWTGHGSGTTASSVNGLNQLTDVGGTAIGHDTKGNLTSDGTRTFTYTAEDRLAQSGSQQLAYDPLGRLFYMPAAGAIFDYDGLDLIVERKASNQITRRYVHGAGVDEPLVWYEGSGTTDRRWLHADERGSIIAVTDSAGTATAINKYDEYGKPQGTLSGRFGFTGQAWLPEIGLYYYKARIRERAVPSAGPDRLPRQHEPLRLCAE